MVDKNTQTIFHEWVLSFGHKLPYRDKNMAEWFWESVDGQKTRYSLSKTKALANQSGGDFLFVICLQRHGLLNLSFGSLTMKSRAAFGPLPKKDCDLYLWFIIGMMNFLLVLLFFYVLMDYETRLNFCCFFYLIELRNSFISLHFY